MKEFNKWLGWEREPGKGVGRYPRYGTTDEDCAAGEAWRAALEWVLSIDSGFCSCGVPNDSWQEDGVLAKIEKEIKE